MLFLNDTAARQKLFNAAAGVSPPPSRLLSGGAQGSRVGSTRRVRSPHSLGPATKAKGGHTYTFCVYVCLSSTFPSVRLVGSYRVPDPAVCMADGLSRFEHRGPRWSLSVAGLPRVSPSRGMGVSESPPTLVKKPSEGRGSASRAVGRRGFPRIDQHPADPPTRKPTNRHAHTGRPPLPAWGPCPARRLGSYRRVVVQCPAAPDLPRNHLPVCMASPGPGTHRPQPSPASRLPQKGLLGSHQSAQSWGPGSAGPHPCPGHGPTLPKFIRIPKSVPPTPRSPSADVGSPKFNDGSPSHSIPPNLWAGCQAATPGLLQQTYREQASPGPLGPLPWWGREGESGGACSIFTRR